MQCKDGPSDAAHRVALQKEQAAWHEHAKAKEMREERARLGAAELRSAPEKCGRYAVVARCERELTVTDEFGRVGCIVDVLECGLLLVQALSCVRAQTARDVSRMGLHRGGGPTQLASDARIVHKHARWDRAAEECSRAAPSASTHSAADVYHVGLRDAQLIM